jgi:hypothetical protein
VKSKRERRKEVPYENKSSSIFPFLGWGGGGGGGGGGGCILSISTDYKLWHVKYGKIEGFSLAVWDALMISQILLMN